MMYVVFTLASNLPVAIQHSRGTYNVCILCAAWQSLNVKSHVANLWFNHHPWIFIMTQSNNNMMTKYMVVACVTGCPLL